jgi:dimeric dUTPase (all-alpha-NTP-PPase superfamily)
MDRRTRIETVEIFLMVEGWRARIEVKSATGERDDVDNFIVSINFPLKETNLPPDEIKARVFEHLKAVFKEVGEVLARSSFEQLWPKDIFWEGAK